MLTCIKIYKQNNNFQFRLTASNGEGILTGESSLSLKDCNKSIGILMMQSKYLHNYCKMKNDDGQYYFIIQSDSQQLLATSHLFWSETSRNYAMNIVNRECFTAIIEKGNG